MITSVLSRDHRAKVSLQQVVGEPLVIDAHQVENRGVNSETINCRYYSLRQV